MNTKIKFSLLSVISILFTFLFGHNAFAQPADGLPATLPITSLEVMVSNAKRQVTKITANIWSRGFVNSPDSVTYVEKKYTPSVPNQPDFAELTALVSMTGFKFETRNPKDEINIRFRYLNSVGRELFSGGQSFKLVKDANGNYVPPSSEIKVKVYPAGDLPIEILNADSVEIALLNERGETTETRNLDRDEATGAFMYPTWLARQQNVQVTAYDYREDGTTAKAVYSPYTGTRQSTVALSTKSSAVFESVIVIQPDTATVILSPVTNSEFGRMIREGRSPLVQISYTKETRVGLYAEYLGQVAKGFWLRRADVLGWNYHQIVNGNQADFTVAPGVYDVIIDGLVNVSQQTFGDRGGSVGKGGVTAIPAPERVDL